MIEAIVVVGGGILVSLAIHTFLKRTLDADRERDA